MYDFNVGDIVVPTVGFAGSTQHPHYLIVEKLYMLTPSTFLCLDLTTGRQTTEYITKNFYQTVA